MAWGGKGSQVSQQKNKKNRLKIGEQFKKLNKFLKGDKNPLQEMRNRQANIANTGSGKKTAAGRIQKKLVEEGGFQKSELRRTQERHEAWKKAKKEGKLKEWEKKYHPDRIASGQSRYGNR